VRVFLLISQIHQFINGRHPLACPAVDSSLQRSPSDMINSIKFIN